MQTSAVSTKKKFLGRLLILGLPALAIGCVALWLFLRSGVDVTEIRSYLSHVLGFLEARPWALVIAIAILPGIGFPLSPLLLLLGITLAPSAGLPATCLTGIAAISVCSIWTYFLSSGPLRTWLRQMISRYRDLPEINDNNMLQVGFILRITPGIPYPFQNVILGVLGMRFSHYLLVSLPITGLWAVAFIVTGGAVFEGKFGLGIAGFLLLISLIIITKMVYKKLQSDA